MTSVPPALLLFTLLATPVGAGTLRVPGDLPLQAALNASTAGDTVLVAPGTYPKAVTVDAAVLVQPDPAFAGPTPVLAGVTGTAATFRDLAFDGSLEAGRGVVIEAGDDFFLDGCHVANGVVGVEVAGYCTVSGSFDNLLTGIVMVSGNVTVSGTFTRCETGVSIPFIRMGYGEGRTPHDPCPLPDMEIVASRFTGGQTAVDTFGSVAVRLTDTIIEGVATGLVADDGCLEIVDSSISGTGTDAGVGVDLVASWCRMVRSSVTGFGTGLRATDDLRFIYSSGTIGGSLADGNTLAGNGVDLALEQPEELAADYNYWGTVECGALGITGMTPDWIADAGFALSVSCLVPAEPTTWGALKARFGGTR